MDSTWTVELTAPTLLLLTLVHGAVDGGSVLPHLAAGSLQPDSPPRAAGAAGAGVAGSSGGGDDRGQRRTRREG